MNPLELHIPSRDDNEQVTVTTITELPRYVDDQEARAVTREALLFFQEAASPSTCTIGACKSVIKDFTADERKDLLDVLRRRAGLTTVSEVKYQEFLDTHVPDTRAAQIVLLPSGALALDIDIQDETARQRTQAASIAAVRQAELAQRTVEAEAMRQHDQALTDQARRETPQGIPTP